MSFPLVLDLAAPGARIRVPVVVTCRVLGFSKQAFYKGGVKSLLHIDLCGVCFLRSCS
jgi:hypothetical protein